jgi:lysophospholipid acyltransferase (LPLAT)-like uncharacterized protein
VEEPKHDGAAAPEETESRAARSRLHRAGCWLLGIVGAAFLRALGTTWRVARSGDDPLAAHDGTTPLVMTIWHGGLLPAAYCWRDRRIAVAVSLSRDGDRIDAVLVRLGFAPSARGSSSRGATGLLRELIRRARAGVPVAILLDGPRGPAGVAKPGAVALARATGARLVPIGIAAAPGFRFGSWDRTVLPFPFARVHVVFGAPVHVPRDASADALEAARAELEAEQHRLDAAAADRL